jgi:uncharacterized iron-regulated membrane protein
MPYRAIFFWFHLITGTVAAAIVLVMAASGVLLTYEKQVVAWAETGPATRPPIQDAPRLPLETLLARAQAERPGLVPSTVTSARDPNAPVLLGLGRDGVLLVNAYTGDVAGSGSSSRAFFRTVTDWHRWLGRTGDSRPVGRAITGACNFAFLFLVLSGIYIWLPRVWTWQKLRGTVWFRTGVPAKARDFNWHHVFGCWSAVPLIVIVLSGVVMSYPWANALVYRVAGETPLQAPQQRPGGDGARGAKAPPPQERHAVSFDGLNRLWSRAAQVEGWRTVTMRLPARADSKVSFTIDYGTGGQPQKRAQLTLDRTTAAVVAWEPFDRLSAGRRLRSILRFAHTGEVLGLAGQTIAGIASFGALMLVYSGLALSLRRFLAWRRRGNSASEMRASSAA